MSSTSSIVVQHTTEESCRIGWEDSTFLSRKPNRYKRRVKERLSSYVDIKDSTSASYGTTV